MYIYMCATILCNFWSQFYRFARGERDRSARFHPYNEVEIRARQAEIDRLATSMALQVPVVDSDTLPPSKTFTLRVLGERRNMIMTVQRDWSFEDFVRYLHICTYSYLLLNLNIRMPGMSRSSQPCRKTSPLTSPTVWTVKTCSWLTTLIPSPSCTSCCRRIG